jgi:hypothetical protein
MSLLSRDRVYRRSTLACLGVAAAGAVLAAFFPWGGLPLVLVALLTGWAFWEQGRRADEVIARIKSNPDDHLLRFQGAGGEIVLGLSGLYQRGELCDFVQGYRVEGVRLEPEGTGVALELLLGSRTGRPMPVHRRVVVPAAHAASAERAARRLAAHYECPLED